MLKPAGLDAAKGLISVGYVKDPVRAPRRTIRACSATSPSWQKYYPDGDKASSLNVYGYITAQLLVQVLKQCGDDLTRENVMKQATNLNNVELDLLLPGITVSTSPTDYRVNKQLQMVKFDGEHWQTFGPIVTDEAKE